VKKPLLSVRIRLIFYIALWEHQWMLYDALYLSCMYIKKKGCASVANLLSLRIRLFYIALWEHQWMLYYAFDPSCMYRKKKRCASVANC